MTPLEFLALGLASAQVVDTWRQGSIFARRRAAVADTVAKYGAHAPLVARLLDCWYCFGHWTPALLIVAFVAGGLAFPAAAPWLWLPIYSLAATRSVVIVDSLMPPGARHGAPGDGDFGTDAAGPVVDAEDLGSLDAAAEAPGLGPRVPFTIKGNRA